MLLAYRNEGDQGECAERQPHQEQHATASELGVAWNNKSGRQHAMLFYKDW